VIEYVNVRVSEILGQGELVAFLKSRFPNATKPLGKVRLEGTECVEVRVHANSAEFEEIRSFINAKRKQGQKGYSNFSIGRYLRKYAKQDLENSEALRLIIVPHFEPAGEECGTIYDTLCEHCNWGNWSRTWF
jgi:predicted DNA-binding antitoxin AbrB/MazE fold protein